MSKGNETLFSGWNIKESLRLLTIFYGCNILLVFSFKLVAQKSLKLNADRFYDYAPYLSSLAYFLAVLMVLQYFNRYRLRMRLRVKEALYLKAPTLRAVTGAVLLAVILIIAYAVAIGYFRPAIPPNPMMRLLDDGWPALVVFFLIAVIIGPITEEILFRACLYDGFGKSLGKIKAAVLVSILFAALHLPPHPLVFIVLFLYSITFICLREQSDSLIPSIIAHQIVNSSALALYLLFRFI